MKYTNFAVLLFQFTVMLRLHRAMESSDPITFHYLPGVNKQTYSKPGDINIGALVRILNNGEPLAENCSDTLRPTSIVIDTIESIAFAVDLINRNPQLLPNVTLGFISHAVCSSRNVALATSLAFLPRSQRVCNDSICTTSPLMSPSHSEWLSHDVIGVLGQGYSSLTIATSYLYAVGHLPLMGITETSNELSNKRDHPSFFRIVPPDRYQVQAILRFIASNGWSYISVVYSHGSYGESAHENTLRSMGKYGICVATSYIVGKQVTTDYDQVVSHLLQYPRARVVVLYVNSASYRGILRAVGNKNTSGHFIWVGSDSLNSYSGLDSVGSEDDPGIGTIALDLYSNHISAFYDHLKKKKVTKTSHPWVKENYEYILECSFDKGTCKPDAEILQALRYKPTNVGPLRIDAVLTYAQAVHNLLSERCPDARGKEARACVTGKLLQEFLKKLRFKGYNGQVKFDEMQDVLGKYIIGQFVYDHNNLPFTNITKQKEIMLKRVGSYHVSSNIVTMSNKAITWSHVNVLERVVPWTEGSIPIEVPESVCSRPCLIGEYKIEKEVTCCWECRRCRDNERLILGNTNCEECPLFTWPDPKSDYTTCIDIPPTYPKPHDTIPIVLISFAVFFLVITIIISICYIIYRNERVIKASSKELSVLQLIAIFIGYTTVILLQTRPTDVMCNTMFFLFCMSFALLYSPLFVKTVRIYRIFKSGAKNERPRFISPQSQFTVAVSLIAVQVILCAVTYVLFVPQAKRSQPIWTEKLVELSCDFTLPGTASFLGYNIVLVSLCSVFAFMVRKLPDNFNESKFISMCVSMTLLIWLAFIPAYFTADREFIRIFLLSTALLFNHSAALSLLFFPKIYAARILPTDSGNFSNAKS